MLSDRPVLSFKRSTLVFYVVEEVFLDFSGVYIRLLLKQALLSMNFLPVEHDIEKRGAENALSGTEDFYMSILLVQ